MAWHRVDPRYLRQPDPDGLTLAYVSYGERDMGHLLLHLDHQRTVARFGLSYDRFLSRCELFAEWDRTDGLRVGEVDVFAGPNYILTIRSHAEKGFQSVRARAARPSPSC